MYDRKIQFAKTPSAVTRIASFSHNINEVSKGILLGSDNFASEVVSKVAASKYIGNTRPATNEDMINMFYDVYKSSSLYRYVVLFVIEKKNSGGLNILVSSKH